MKAGLCGLILQKKNYKSSLLQLALVLIKNGHNTLCIMGQALLAATQTNNKVRD